jgi:hypothetical protein
MPRIARYNAALLQQAVDLIDWCLVQPQRAAFADTIGPHLRHILEHYEELFEGKGRRVIEYDRRQRDRRVEQDPELARIRFVGLVSALGELGSAAEPHEELAVMLCGGIDGEDQFVTTSTLPRELLFLASHTVHHYAIVKPVLVARGYEIGGAFGKAPATIHFEREAGC